MEIFPNLHRWFTTYIGCHCDEGILCYTCCRYDLSCVDVLEAFAAEGLAVFSGSLPEGTALKFLQNLVLTALKANLGYLGECVVPAEPMPSASIEPTAVAGNNGGLRSGARCVLLYSVLNVCSNHSVHLLVLTVELCLKSAYLCIGMCRWAA